MPQQETLIYTFTIKDQASHFNTVVLKNYLNGAGKNAGIKRSRLDGCAIVMVIDSSKRNTLLPSLDFLANHNGGVRDEGIGGAAVPVENRPYPPKGPNVLSARARPPAKTHEAADANRIRLMPTRKN